jgi:Calcineurin-like phosphoesterase
MPISADHAIEVFTSATEENQLCSRRQNQVVYLPNEGEVWMTGDMHDHRRNFDKVSKAADLSNNPQRHLVLHELIHGDRIDANGCDGSWETLYKAAELKCDHPSQVHFLLANHDLAQIQGEGILKAGMSVCEAFTAGVRRDFGDRYASVNVAISEFLLSLPLAIRTGNNLFFCHSLPTDAEIPNFDYGVFDRALTGADYRRRTGPVYQLIWGRNVTPAGVEQFANTLGVSVIVTGHQPQDTGFAINGQRHLIVASDHNQGVFIPIDLSQNYDMPKLSRQIKKYAALAV